MSDTFKEQRARNVALYAGQLQITLALLSGAKAAPDGQGPSYAAVVDAVDALRRIARILLDGDIGYDNANYAIVDQARLGAVTALQGVDNWVYSERRRLRQQQRP